MTEEEINQFFLDNRTKSADTVNSIYNDPRYASTIFNTSVPLPQLEKNIQQSQGYMLEPAYNPTFRDKSSDYITSAFEYLKSKGIMDKSVREGKATSRDITEGFTGTEDSIGLVDATPIGSLFAAQEGQRKIMKAEPDALKRQMGLLSFMNKPFQTYLDRPELAEGAFDVATGATEAFGFGYLARPLYKKIEPFAKSLAKKLKGETSIVPTKEEVGALPKVLANTANKQPSMAVTDPKVVDDLGFYSEAERQTKLLQQNKGGGEQFKGMLLNKGVKADELDALGLIELFKQPKVTKQEILDTIEFNKVKLIETKRTGKGSDYYDDFDDETFTDIRREDGTSFTTADEVKDAYDTGKYIDTEINYDGMYNGTVNTHLPTGYKTLYLRKSGHDGENLQDIYLTFKPDADVNDWRNSVEAENYVAKVNQRDGYETGQTLEAETKNLQWEDFDIIADDEASFSFDEATVRLRAAAINSGDYNPNAYARFGNSTQPGGTNYKEYVLSLPPKNKSQTYQSGTDFQYTTHFPEYNPVFHIRTKDRTTPDGKKVLYVEELQSDWGQQGRKKGFQKSEQEMIEISNKKKEAQAKLDKYEKQVKDTGKDLVGKELDEANESKSYLQKTQTFVVDNDRKVPKAPFVKDTEKWTGLAMKRLIKLAEEGGYDHVAFSPGDVQFDRWREEGLKKYYDEIIPSVAQDVTRKMSDKSSNMKTTTRDLEVQIPSERSIGISQRGDGKYFVNIQGSDKPIDNKFFNTREEAYDFADMVDEQRTNQKTFAINITPKVRDTARSGQAMFSLAAGLTAGASALSNQDVGALGSLPNDGT
jgi:hypothetical protein